MSEVVYITTPVGRLVWGSVNVPKTKDSKGNLLVIKKGPEAGKPNPRYEFGLAIPKGVETHWSQTVWGRQIWDTAHKAFNNKISGDFSWKVTDGDSKELTAKGKPAPSTREGHPGHWVLAFSSSFAPECLDKTGAGRIDPASIKKGYYIQVAGSIKGNNGSETDGVYLNSKYVSLQAFGPEISSGPDPMSLGFGLAAMPTGASATPTSQLVAPVQAPPAPVAPAPTVAAPPVVVVPPTVVAPPLAVVPHTAILAPPAPPAPPARKLTPKAGGATYEQLLAAGWTDATLLSEGVMVA